MLRLSFDWSILFLWFIPVLFLHELGHYVSYRFFGIKPKLKFRWWGIQIGEIKDTFKLKPYQLYLIGCNGVVAGLIYTSSFNNPVYLFIYFLMCIMDLVVMYQSFTLGRKKPNQNMGELYIEYIKKQLKELKNAKNKLY